MKVIFLNTWHGEMKSELCTYIKKHMRDTEVFCFQEAAPEDRTAYESLLAGNFMLHAAERRQTSGGWYGNVVYVCKDIAVVNKGSLFVADAEGFDVGIAVYVCLQISDVQLTICNVHGVPLPGHKTDTPDRLYQSKVILETFAADDAVIVGGDFNLLPDTQSIHTFVEHGYRNLITDFQIKTTRNHISYKMHPNSIQYYADYVFASPTIKVIDFVVPSDLVSDHQPLELTFSCLVPLPILQPDLQPHN